MDSVFDQLSDLCDHASKQTILCVGDIMVDRFVYGAARRVSPEAPIPVLQQKQVQTMLGAVGNVARNVSSLGAEAIICSVRGNDPEGNELAELVEGVPRITGRFIEDDNRETTVKIRFVANGQQLLRVDREVTSEIEHNTEQVLCAHIRDSAVNATAILLSDYAKGCVTDAVIAACLEAAENNSIPLVVDPKGTDFARYGAADLIKPNLAELAGAIGRPLSSDAEVEVALKELLERIPAKALLVTRSENGLSFLDQSGNVRHFPAEKREVFDVSGAGDTSLAAIGIAFAEKVAIESAAQFALIASGIAVSKAGTATVSNQEVRDALEIKLTNLERRSRRHLPIEERISAWRSEGLKIGFTNGCFDILHAGHIKVLDFAAQHCDRLIVGLNSDASVRRLKGAQRPINSQGDRREVLAALKAVDAVLIFDEDTPFELVQSIQPDLIVKGGDYRPEDVVGSDIVLSRGGEVLICPLMDGRSTTNIIERSRSD